MPRLIWVFAGRTLILLVLSCHGSYLQWLGTYLPWYFLMRNCCKILAVPDIGSIAGPLCLYQFVLNQFLWQGLNLQHSVALSDSYSKYESFKILQLLCKTCMCFISVVLIDRVHVSRRQLASFCLVQICTGRWFLFYEKLCFSLVWFGVNLLSVTQNWCCHVHWFWWF